MTMTLGQVRDRLREMPGMDRIDAIDIHEMADAIDAHLTQPAQSVDVEKVREVIAELRTNVSPLDGYHSPKFHAWADKLTAALPEAIRG